MFTRGDKQFLAMVGFLVIAAIVSYVTMGHYSREVGWVPDGLNVLAYMASPFLDEELSSYVDQFQAETGIKVNVVRTTEWEDAMLRSVVDGMPIDIVMVPFDMRDDLRREGKVIELHTVLDEFPNPNFQSAMRWLWSSIGDKPICGFLIGEFGDPTFSCIWYRTNRAEAAAEFISYLVVNTSVSESRLVQPNHFARKYIIEQDYGPLYDHLLHPSHRELTNRERFVNRGARCSDGVIQNLRVTSSESNRSVAVDPRTWIYYDPDELMEHQIEYQCIQDTVPSRHITYLVQTLDDPLPSVFIPDTSLFFW